MIKVFLIISLAFSLSFAQDFALAKGEVLVLEFDAKDFKHLVLKHSNSKQVLKPFKHPKKEDKFVYIFSSPYKKPLNNAKIIIQYKTHQITHNIFTQDKAYIQERLKVAQDKVKPAQSVQKRIEKEFKEANKIYATYTDKKLFDKEFILPLDSNITSKYGNARIFNNTLASYHSGTDFRALTGTAIRASNDGIVVLAQDRYYAGKSIIIDHGYGIFTQYYHLSEFKVKQGQKVKKGQIIALSGSSGRVTAPHLHFGTFVKGAQVDPMQFIKQFNLLFD